VARVRVSELAKEYGVTSKEVLEKLTEMGEFVKAASSAVEPPVKMRFEQTYGAELRAKAEAAAAKKAAKKAPAKKAAKAPAKKAAAKKAPATKAPATTSANGSTTSGTT
jgi:translation initiation factor IF-2